MESLNYPPAPNSTRNSVTLALALVSSLASCTRPNPDFDGNEGNESSGGQNGVILCIENGAATPVSDPEECVAEKADTTSSSASPSDSTGLEVTGYFSSTTGEWESSGDFTGSQGGTTENMNESSSESSDTGMQEELPWPCDPNFMMFETPCMQCVQENCCMDLVNCISGGSELCEIAVGCYEDSNGSTPFGECIDGTPNAELSQIANSCGGPGGNGKPAGPCDAEC